MTKINDPKNLNGKLFGYEIKYNLVEGLETPNIDFADLKVKPKYNGNIAEVDWKSNTIPGDNLRRYGYVYDKLNRLSAGFYQKDTNPSAKEYFEKMDYDLNGNITNLKRSAASQQGAPGFLIDNLTYGYFNNGNSNRLISVTDGSTVYDGYPDTSGITIPYDANGNMTSHEDKGILQIDYNFLNLPDNLKFDDTYVVRNLLGGTTETRNITTKYLFRADGTKLSKLYTYGVARNQSESYKMTDYLDGFQYEAQGASLSLPRVLKFVPTAEGYYNFENNKYIYNYTDHLGNVRLSYMNNGSGATVVEENNYYPFGMKHDGYNPLIANQSYQYKYNGKELQTESGMYDYGARFYMPDIGRWGVVDPLAEKMTRHSPYNYAFNNPIMFIDPDGMQGNDWFWDSNKKTFTYDASLTSAAQFNTLKDQGLVQGEYLGKSGSWNVTLGNETIGKVNLQDDGSWTNMTDSNSMNWEYHSADADSRTQTQYFTNFDSSRNWGVQVLDKPFTIGIGGEATVGAGFEIGYFSGNYDSGIYANVYKSAGFNLGVGGAYNEYTTQNGYAPLTTANFSGNYWNISGGVGPISGNYGETAKDADGRNVSMGGASISSSIWNFLKRPKLSIGGSAQAGTTYINPSKRIRESEK